MLVLLVLKMLDRMYFKFISSLSGRILASTLWCFSIVIICMYLAILMSTDIRTEQVEQSNLGIRTIQDLARQTNVKYGCIKSGSTCSYFQVRQYKFIVFLQLLILAGNYILNNIDLLKKCSLYIFRWSCILSTTVQICYFVQFLQFVFKIFYIPSFRHPQYQCMRECGTLWQVNQYQCL